MSLHAKCSLCLFQIGRREALEDALEDLAYRYNARKLASATTDGPSRICTLSPTQVRAVSPEHGAVLESSPAERDLDPGRASAHLFDSSLWFAAESAAEASVALVRVSATRASEACKAALPALRVRRASEVAAAALTGS